MLPIILGIIAVSSAVTAYNGIDMAIKKDEIDKIKERVEAEANKVKKEGEAVQKQIEKHLSELDNLYIKVYKEDFARFAAILNELKKEVHIKEEYARLIAPSIKLFEDFKDYKDVIDFFELAKTTKDGVIAGGLCAGGLVGAATAFGTASTGTAIGTLSGAAYTNALLAYLGGGSLATGGLGVAGGSLLLGGSFIAPVLAVFSIGANMMMEKQLTEVKKWERESIKQIEEAKKEIEKAKAFIKQISLYREYFLELRDKFSITLYSTEVYVKRGKISEAFHLLQSCYELAKALKELMKNPLDENLRRF